MREKMTMAAVAVMMAVSAYVGANSLTPSEQLSGIMLENVEALANDESTICTYEKVNKDQDKHELKCSGHGDQCCIMNS